MSKGLFLFHRWLGLQIGSEGIVTIRWRFQCVFAGLMLGVVVAGCGRRDNQAASLADAPLEAHQRELLEIAFHAASAIPSDPHIKSRSQAQAAVVTACLELNQPQRALGYIERIDDWRRGTAYADLAKHCMRRGFKTDVEAYLSHALKIAEGAEDWRKDRIVGQVAVVRAMSLPMADFDAEMAVQAKMVSSQQFDALKEALATYVRLFNRVYSDVQRRTTVEESIRASWDKMPGFVRLDLMIDMIEHCLAHSDRTKALDLVKEARSIADSTSWQPTIEIPLKAKLARLRFLAGDPERASEEAKDALELFDTKRDQIANIYRAQTLRPIAEAHRTMGKADVAIDLYARAVEAGVENPNSRPRAEDLAATCCSMAMQGAEPSLELLSRIREIREGLGDPW
jgi:tetratricopeptide (TPR) repeat protein